jgi:hypothetical protein
MRSESLWRLWWDRIQAAPVALPELQIASEGMRDLPPSRNSIAWYNELCRWTGTAARGLAPIWPGRGDKVSQNSKQCEVW